MMEKLRGALRGHSHDVALAGVTLLLQFHQTLENPSGSLGIPVPMLLLPFARY